MGQYTIRQVLYFTNRFFASRFSYMRRDVLKKIYIRNRKYFDSKGRVTKETFYATTMSYPQYYPYQRGVKRQRKIRHEYDIILLLDQLSVDTTEWKLRVGSNYKWVYKVSPKLLRSKKNPYGIYLNVGDYNARQLRINGDFYFRQATPLKKYGHLYGPLRESFTKNEIPFFGKHDLRFLSVLVKKGILKAGVPAAKDKGKEANSSKTEK